MQMRRRGLLFVAILLFFGWGCASDGEPKQEGQLVGATSGGSWTADFPTGNESSSTMSVRESEASSSAGSSVGRPGTEKLSSKETESLLGRLSPIQTEQGDNQAFAKRADSPPPPRTGEEVDETFPPQKSQDRPTAGESDADKPLEIVRYAPEGEVQAAPRVSVTFNQPMVSVTSRKELSDPKIPIEIKPEPEGRWKWIGTKTLVFEPSGKRLAHSTTYNVMMPIGVSSVSGASSVEPTRWSFSTPRLELESRYPTGKDIARSSPFFLSFNQKIDRKKLLKNVQIRADGAEYGSDDIRLVSPDELDEAPQRLKQLVEKVQDGTWVLFELTETLPYDRQVSVVIEKGAPSAEGPLKTLKPQRFKFRTYGPLTASLPNYAQCTKQNPDCPPHSAFRIRFSNDVPAKYIDPEYIDVEPDIEDMKVRPFGRGLMILGNKPGGKSYTLTLSRNIKDDYGQNLTGQNQFKYSVGHARPYLRRNTGHFVVLDPDGEPEFSLTSVNYKNVNVELRRVEPSDWGTFLNSRYLPRRREQAIDMERPGEVVSKRKVPTGGQIDVPTRVDIELEEALGKDGLGNVVAIVEPGEVMEGAQESQRPGVVRAWLQRTNIGLDAFVDNTELVAWATDLATGEPKEGVTVELDQPGETGKTGEKGVHTFELPNEKSHGEPPKVVARKGEDVAFLPNQSIRTRRVGGEHGGQKNLRWMVFDDRKMYRPGETVRLKGWTRIAERWEGGGIRLPGREEVGAIRYRVMGPRGNEIETGEVEPTKLGGFDFSFGLPDTPNLGTASVMLTAEGFDGGTAGSTHSFEIQEFRRPKFEVGVSADSEPKYSSEAIETRVEATYFTGGPLGGAEVSWKIQKESGSYSPPGHSAYRFGDSTPWWFRGGDGKDVQTLRRNGKTTAAGRHALDVSVDINDGFPRTVSAEATVEDVDRQQISSSTEYIVHPARYYVGLKTDTYFVEKGEPMEVDCMVADVDGNLKRGHEVTMRLVRLESVYEDGEYKSEEHVEETCRVETAGKKGETSCKFEPKKGGQYRIEAITADEKGRVSRTRIRRWVSGGSVERARRVKKEKVSIVPDSDSYQPGDDAELLIQSPIAPAEVLLTVRRHGMVKQRRFSMKEPTKTVEVSIKNSYIPNAFVQVDVVGSQPRLDEDGNVREDLPERPAFASGQLKLDVPPIERRLDVGLDLASDEVKPGSETSVDVSVNSAAGEPVEGAEVALIVVDEAILSLTNYKMPDPIDVFYRQRPESVSDYYLREYVHLAETSEVSKSKKQGVELGDVPSRGRGGGAMQKESIEMLGARAKSASADSASGGSESKMIAVRRDKDPLVAFEPAIRTNKNGEATVKLEMPDNLTRYRVMAVAVKGGTKFGSDEDNITARLPLMVRPTAPRFLHFGDEFQLPVVVHNQTDKELKADLAVRGANLELEEPRGKSVKVPADDRVEVLFPAEAKEAGTARLQVAGSTSDGNADASELSLPVWTPATNEAFATYGTIDKGSKSLSVQVPDDVWRQFGGLNVSTSSTALQALTDAFLYLYDYDFACTEQIASRMLSVAALRDVLSAFDAEGMPSQEKVETRMNDDIEQLVKRQTSAGAFGLWSSGTDTWPFVSLHAIHALMRAEQKGYSVPSEAMSRSSRYLKNIDRRLRRHDYPTWTQRFIKAYSLYLRDLKGDADPVAAKKLLAEAGGPGNLPFGTLGWLLGVFSGQDGYGDERKQIQRFLMNRVTETAATAHFASRYSEDGHLIMHSDRRADAIILEALMEASPDSDLIPKIVKGLLAHRKKGRWSNTQENAFVLLALDKYFRIYEDQEPDFVARAWLGEKYAGEHAFRGRTTERHRISVPMKTLEEEVGEDKKSSLLLQKDGKGRMYYRVGMEYAPKSLYLDAADYGFAVERTYKPVGDEDSVRQQDDGTWVIEPGATVKVKVTMVAPTRRYHVALTDPLPAGMESLSPALATTGSIADEQRSRRTGGRYWWWHSPWYEHQNMRDERVEAFASTVWGGVHEYTYYARATIPGEFVVPPAKAKEMYHPETFGRSSSDTVVIEN